MSIYIIAEAGVNHNGSFETACRMVDAAKAAGTDCIKFQTFRARNLVSRYAQKAEYQKNATGEGSQAEMLKKLELSQEEFIALKAYCDQVGICFLSTPFDLESIAFLNTMDMPFWKIPSGEVTDYPYLVALAKTAKPVVMSTGMCELGEISDAIRTLKENGTTDIRLLHCNTEYPTPLEDVNLRAMNTLREMFKVDVGYSDHTRGIVIPIAAAAMGAIIIEKHFTLDRDMEGPDHKASLEPEELKLMVQSIRNVEKALGSTVKKPSASEKKNIALARKSIVAKRKIQVGEVLTEENLTVKRPGNGISPMMWNRVIGKKVIQDFEEDEQIRI